MSTGRDPHRDELERDEIRAHIEEMRANVDWLRDRRAQWEVENRRENRRLLLYGILTLAAALAAGGALWEAIRP